MRECLTESLSYYVKNNYCFSYVYCHKFMEIKVNSDFGSVLENK